MPDEINFNQLKYELARGALYDVLNLDLRVLLELIDAGVKERQCGWEKEHSEAIEAAVVTWVNKREKGRA